MLYSVLLCVSSKGAGRLTWRYVKLSCAVIGLRVLYTFLYIGIDTQSISYLRTLTWNASVGCCLYMLIKAGNVLANGTRMVL